jgi:hypothetical protein
VNLQDALFNWLQIKIVADARQDDGAAQETLAFFEEILREDHHLTHFRIERMDETMYHVAFGTEGTSMTQCFDREQVEQLLSDINSNPKYNE